MEWVGEGSDLLRVEEGSDLSGWGRGLTYSLHSRSSEPVSYIDAPLNTRPNTLKPQS